MAALVTGLVGFLTGILTLPLRGIYVSLMSWFVGMTLMALAYIGGAGSLLGGVFATFLLIPIFDSLKELMEYCLIIYGMLLILVMIFYPAGLSGVYQKGIQFITTLRGKKNENC